MEIDRRAFLQGAAMAAACQLPAAPATAPLPQFKLGQHALSRLVCGANPFNGYSHLSTFFSRRQREYYTPERILATLRRCQDAGINAWQSGPPNVAIYRDFTAQGLKMQFLAIDSGDGGNLAALKTAGTIAVAHHGEMTDRFFKTGNFDKVYDFVKRTRDLGMLAGISTHMPAVVDTVESKGWDVDYFMTCVYERHRSEADLKKLLGYTPLPVGEVYLKEDPPRMFKMVRQTKRTCLAFKILAAGRSCDRPELVEAAFRETFAAIKPGDGVIVGMYDEYGNQPAENAALVRKYGAV